MKFDAACRILSSISKKSLSNLVHSTDRFIILVESIFVYKITLVPGSLSYAIKHNFFKVLKYKIILKCLIKYIHFFFGLMCFGPT